MPPRRLKIDFGEFQLALEGFDSVGGELVGHFLDTETGEILVLCRDWEDYEELSLRLDAGLGDRYRRIERLESGERFRIMQDFADALPESALRSRLFDALSRNKPFRRFKDIVHSDLALRDQWFAFCDDTHTQHVREWLESEGIEADLSQWVGFELP